MKSYLSTSPQATEAFAQELARQLRAGDVLAFRGGMGAGKTAFVRGLARGLGCTSEVSSPTFALVHEYGGTPPLYHFDMYRIETLEDLHSTGYFDYLDAGGILAVEWSERIDGVLEENAIYITMEPVDETTRKITLEGGGRF